MLNGPCSEHDCRQGRDHRRDEADDLAGVAQWVLALIAVVMLLIYWVAS